MPNYNEELNNINLSLDQLQKKIEALPNKKEDSFKGVDENKNIILNQSNNEIVYLDSNNAPLKDYLSIKNYRINQGILKSGLIKENIFPAEAVKMQCGNQIIDLPQAETNYGKKLYSFLAISDVHITSSTAQDDFNNALKFVEDGGADFVCITGDLTNDGSAGEFDIYKSIVKAHSKAKVYAISGNHDNITTSSQYIIQKYTDFPSYYSFSPSPLCDDVFIMLGIKSSGEDVDRIFYEGELDWLYEILEKNRGKRCFIFEHEFLHNGAGNARKTYPWDSISHESEKTLNNLFAHYKNVFFFTGHSHFTYDLQQYDSKANFFNGRGFTDIHLPSITKPRIFAPDDNDYAMVTASEKSEGTIIEVYENGVLIKGRDFISKKLNPMALYYVPTPKTSVPEKSFIDNNYFINKNVANKTPLALNWHIGKADKITGAIDTSITNYCHTDLISVDSEAIFSWDGGIQGEVRVIVYNEDGITANYFSNLDFNSATNQYTFKSDYYLAPGMKVRFSIWSDLVSENFISQLNKQTRLEKAPYLKNIPFILENGDLNKDTGEPIDRVNYFRVKDMIPFGTNKDLIIQARIDTNFSIRKMYYRVNDNYYCGTSSAILQDNEINAIKDISKYRHHKENQMKFRCWTNGTMSLEQVKNKIQVFSVDYN